MRSMTHPINGRLEDDMQKFTPLDRISRIASEREVMHEKDASSRQLTENTNETGLRGEFAFAELCGIYPDVSKKRNGDGGIDFILPVFMKIDVKTRKERPGGLDDLFLLVEENKVVADIYVLAVLSKDETKCECVGWIRKAAVLDYPIGDLGTGVRNHQVPANKLNPMKSLINRVAKWPKPEDVSW